jgi:beta-N-acetylhexosaminidase
MMPAHVVYEQVDSEPAGFSSKWLQQVLKHDMKFTGHIVSDDLSMQGAAVKGDYKARSSAALTAGCDILLACNSSDASTQILAAMEALNVEPLRLEKYRPDINLLTENNDLYMNAKQLLISMELIK